MFDSILEFSWNSETGICELRYLSRSATEHKTGSTEAPNLQGIVQDWAAFRDLLKYGGKIFLMNTKQGAYNQ